MKSKDLNNSSKKTKRIIKNTFAEMLSEKKEISKVSVSELCLRCEISRGTFYSHYEDIYGVAEDYEEELITNFFDKARLLTSNNVEIFIDVFFEYIRSNDDNYKLLCKSNDFVFTARKLSSIAINKLLDLCKADLRIHNKKNIELDISIFIQGLLCEYIKYCRGYSNLKLNDLYEYTKQWTFDFINKRT